MAAVLDGRDSLVVLPTGGGKSLCYQAPAVLGGTTVVIAAHRAHEGPGRRPAGLRRPGRPDRQLAVARRTQRLRDGRASRERSGCCSSRPNGWCCPISSDLLQQIDVQHLRHRRGPLHQPLGPRFPPRIPPAAASSKELFPGASVHAYTATATEQVRRDIVEQLGLTNPAVLVGNFDRPNLTYRVLPRHDLMTQVARGARPAPAARPASSTASAARTWTS